MIPVAKVSPSMVSSGPGDHVVTWPMLNSLIGLFWRHSRIILTGSTGPTGVVGVEAAMGAGSAGGASGVSGTDCGSGSGSAGVAGGAVLSGICESCSIRSVLSIGRTIWYFVPLTRSWTLGGVILIG